MPSHSWSRSCTTIVKRLSPIVRVTAASSSPETRYDEAYSLPELDQTSPADAPCHPPLASRDGLTATRTCSPDDDRRSTKLPLHPPAIVVCGVPLRARSRGRPRHDCPLARTPADAPSNAARKPGERRRVAVRTRVRAPDQRVRSPSASTEADKCLTSKVREALQAGKVYHPALGRATPAVLDGSLYFVYSCSYAGVPRWTAAADHFGKRSVRCRVSKRSLSWARSSRARWHSRFRRKSCAGRLPRPRPDDRRRAPPLRVQRLAPGRRGSGVHIPEGRVSERLAARASTRPRSPAPSREGGRH